MLYQSSFTLREQTTSQIDLSSFLMSFIVLDLVKIGSLFNQFSWIPQKETNRKCQMAELEQTLKFIPPTRMETRRNRGGHQGSQLVLPHPIKWSERVRRRLVFTEHLLHAIPREV